MKSKTKFKKTPIGEIPEVWKVVKVKELFEVKTGTTPSTKQLEYWENGKINWITPTDLSKLNGNIYIGDSERKISKRALKDYNLNLLPKGSLVLSTRAPVGYVAVLTKESTFNQGCKGLIPRDKNKVVPEFYAYYFKFKRQHLESLSGGSTFKELAKNMLERFLIPLPPLPEQKKIAEILRAVDEAIEKTDLAIERTERLKRGLMRELLTKGIGHREFKKTELGRIPKEWEVLTVGELIDRGIILKIQDGNHGELHPKSHEFSNSGVPFITANCIKNNKLDLKECKFLPNEVVRRLVKGFTKPGDVLLTHKGSVGLTAIVPVNLDLAVLSPQVTYYRLNEEKLRNEFLYYVFQSSYFKRQLLPLSKQSTRDYISLDRQKRLKIPLPPLSEQQKIAEILSTVDRRLELLRKRREKLERIKRGLMKDLLTGRRRVKDQKLSV